VSVTEIKQALGGWQLRLRPDTPRELLAALSFYGHIAVVPGQLDPVQYGDSLLTTARYVGVYRGKDSQDSFTLKGSGMAFWLGDEDDKGDVLETAVVLTGATFAASITALLPAGGAVTAGTINAIAGLYTGKHQWETPRQAITYVTDTYNGEWRVNGNATLDAGTVAQLYNTNPVAILTPRGKGADLLRKALAGKLAMGVDVEDTTTRVVLLAEGSGDAIATGTADAVGVPYKDLHGNTLRAVRVVSESGTESGNATARAQLQLNRFLNPRRSAQLTSSEYDIKGTFVVGDYIEVYDPANGFYDVNREVYWEGDRINPMALRCVEMTWPIPDGWTVGFRDINGVWFDLSRWYLPEGGDTTIVVGDLARGLSSVGGEPVGIRPNLPEAGADFTIPGAPVFGTFSSGNYQGDDGEWTKSAILVTWTQPLNTDLSTITDGGHYEIRYRVNAFIGYGVRWGQLTPYRWADLTANRWGAPITDPVATGEWHTLFVPWGQLQMLVQELTPSVEYEFQIRAVDAADPPHQGAWSASTFFVADRDLFAPSIPAAPTVASNPVSIQVIHTLGKASAGAYTLEPDLAYLSVHVGNLSSFLPTVANSVGRLLANASMIAAQIPAVGTFVIPDTANVWVKVVAVDRAGNESPPSAGVQSSVTLIDNAHISDLSVSKVTAGTITAAWILAGSIKTANTGARVEVDSAGIRAYKSTGAQTLNVDSTTGFVDITGRFTAQTDAGAIIRMDPVAGGDDPFMFLQASNVNVNRGHLAQFGSGGTDVTELSSKNLSHDSVDGGRIWLSQTGASMVVAPEGSTIQPGISVAGTDVVIRGTGQVQITADAGSGAAVAKYLAFSSGTIISHTPSGGVETFVGVGYPSTDRLSGRGKMSNGFGAADGMFYSNGIIIGAGFGAITVTYGPTMTSAIFPMYAISGATPNFSHCITTSTLTNFAVAWSDVLGHNIWIWVVRS
jgi:hypothetical protein